MLKMAEAWYRSFCFQASSGFFGRPNFAPRRAQKDWYEEINGIERSCVRPHDGLGNPVEAVSTDWVEDSEYQEQDRKFNE